MHINGIQVTVKMSQTHAYAVRRDFIGISLWNVSLVYGKDLKIGGWFKKFKEFIKRNNLKFVTLPSF